MKREGNEIIEKISHFIKYIPHLWLSCNTQTQKLTTEDLYNIVQWIRLAGHDANVSKLSEENKTAEITL